MQRNLKTLANQKFDVVIVGGGIYGAALAREAALRGLSTALIDKRDFCGATSANSLKIIHGGLRYLQQADLIRVRESVRERRTMLRIAPHLVRPLPCLMPTTGILKSKPAMAIALLVNDLLSTDRNHNVNPDRQIPRGYVAPRPTLNTLLPGYTGTGNGVALWTDAVADDTERIVVDMIHAAADCGACVANYTECTGFIHKNNRVSGIHARDRLHDNAFDIQATLVINAAGPWSNTVLEPLSRSVRPLPYALALGMNAILKREIFPTHAAGLPCQQAGPDKGRLMFIVPWQGTTMAGTFYRHHTRTPDGMQPDEADTQRLLDQLNSAMPGVNLAHDDIARIHAGLLPCKPGRAVASDPALLRHYSLVDHARRDGMHGLITVLGVKYTTARDVAEKTITYAGRKLNRTLRPSTSAITPLPNTPTDVSHTISHAMVHTLSDLIYRRTGLGAAAVPDDTTLRTCTNTMAAAFGWNASRSAAEIAHARNPLA